MPPTPDIPADPFADHPDGLDPRDVAEQVRSGRLQLVDLLEPRERPAPTVDGARNMPLSELANDAMTLDHDRPIAFLSGRGRTAMLAARACQGVGMIAHPVAGGVVAWIDAGLPFRRP